ncbi:MAG: DUF488 domain-containing protein [Dehalococcoidia bacterium]|nr:DUF488 domain-containing protein [Dehalococcoidia bacterium]
MITSALKLPEKTKSEQQQSKLLWNSKHCVSEPDFFTIGYSGKNIDHFVNLVKEMCIATLVDIRFSPVSRFKPEFSKNNLKKSLEAAGITYVHRPDWGVPRDIRAFSIGKQTREDIWNWYDSNILPNVVKRNLDEFFNSMEHPIALMCVEHDPTECHRHRVFLGLERIGLTGCDL